MVYETLAPWAESAPGAGYPLTEDALRQVPDDCWTYELVEGRLVRMAPAAGGASSSALSLGGAMAAFVEAHHLGRVTGADGTYVLSKPGEPTTALAPDVAFVRKGRYPSPDSPEFWRFWHVAPDLAVEVVSFDQYRPEMARKAHLYLHAGVRLLWLVWPKYRHVAVWRPGADQPVATIGIGEQWDGLDVLPGFTYPVARLFS